MLSQRTCLLKESLDEVIVAGSIMQVDWCTTTEIPLKLTMIWIILASLSCLCGAETTVVAETKLIVLPGPNDDSIQNHASLTCFITPEGSNTRWITPDEVSVLSIQHHEQYAITQGDIAIISGEMIYGSILIIRDISYKNEGIYVCEVLTEEDCSDFPKFAIIHLVLKMMLTVANSNITVKYNDSIAQSVELECEASGYIRPDSDIQWYKDDEKIVEGVKYSVVFRNSSVNAAQTGLNMTTANRISMLTINDLSQGDVGTYNCKSQETGEVARLYLNVEYDQHTNPDSSSTMIVETNPTSLPSKTPTFSSPSTDESSTNCSVGIAVAIVCTFFLTSILVAVVTVMILYMWYRFKHNRKIKSGVSSPDLGSTAHATSHTNVSEQVDMYRISTGCDIEGSSGDSPDNATTTQ